MVAVFIMQTAAIGLPTDVSTLHSLLRDEQLRIENLHSEIERLKEIIRLFQAQRFGAKSEKLGDPDQLWMFNEAERAVNVPEPKSPQGSEEVAVASHTRKGKGVRKTLPEHLVRHDVVHDLAEEDKVCPHDGHALHRIGEEVSEQLTIIPAKLEVIRHIRPKYGCRQCESLVKIASMPPQAIPKSMASPSALAYIATAKYEDALPLYRQSKIFERLDIDLPRSTLADWMVKAGELVKPLMNLMHEDLLGSSYVHMDETRVQVLKEPGRAAKSLSQAWVLARGGPKKIVFFEYDPSRSGEVARRLLGDFQGYLQTDGYKGYDLVGKKPGIIHLACMAHVRRKFHEAVEARKKGGKPGVADEVLALIAKLYEVEAEGREMDPMQRKHLRDQKSRPILDSMRSLLDRALITVPPKTLTGKGAGYTHKLWPRLIRYLDDGCLQIDNNFIENCIRPFAIGRKNWQFSHAPCGAHASMALYSMIETAKANDVNTYDYLCYVFAELPKAKILADYERLLPYNIDRKQLRSNQIN